MEKFILEGNATVKVGTQLWFLILQSEKCMPYRDKSRTVVYHQYMMLKLLGADDVAAEMYARCGPLIALKLPVVATDHTQFTDVSATNLFELPAGIAQLGPEKLILF